MEENIDEILQRKEQEYLTILTKKVKNLEVKLSEKDELIIHLTQELEDLKIDYDHNIEVIQERDEDIALLAQNIEKLHKEIDKKTQYETSFSEQTEKMKTEYDISLKAKDFQIKNLIDKQDSLKNDIKYYKSGYLNEIQDFQETIKKLKNQLETQKSDFLKIISEKEKEMALFCDQSGKETRNLMDKAMAQETSCGELKRIINNLNEEIRTLKQQLHDNDSLKHQEHDGLKRKLELVAYEKEEELKTIRQLNDRIKQKEDEIYQIKKTT